MSAGVDPEGGLEIFRRILGHPTVHGAAVGAVALAVYVRSLAPSVMWYDMGEFATSAYTLGIAHNTGYPLFMLLAKLFTFLPVGDPAYRVNLFSAVAAAATVAFTYVLVYRLTARKSAALLSAALFAFSSTLWGNATWAEAYTLNAFLTVSILLLLDVWRRREDVKYLYGAILLFGLGLGNHRLLIGFLPVLAYALYSGLGGRQFRPSRGELARMAIAFAVGFSVHVYLPLRAMANPPVLWADASDPATFIQMVTTGKANTEAFYNPFGDLSAFEHVAKILGLYPTYELTLPGLILALLGAVVFARRDRPMFAATALIAGFSLVMVSSYGIHDIFNYFLPIYQMACLWFGWTVAAGVELAERELEVDEGLTLWGPSARKAVLIVMLAIIPLRLFLTNYRLLDRSGHVEPVDFAEFVLSTLPEDAVVLSDFWTWTPLLYFQVVNGRRPDITIYPALADADLDLESLIASLEQSGVPVYLTTRFEDAPGNRLGPYSLRLISPYPVRGFPTDSQPLPSYKDRLVPRGALYRVARGRPELEVESVPTVAEIDPVNFDGVIQLMGYSFEHSMVSRGDALGFTLYWRLASRANNDLWADVLFTDPEGEVRTEAGIPIWLASHWIGGGAFPTTDWSVDRLYKESYLSLVPQEVKPGRYQVRLLVYAGGVREGRLPAKVEGAVMESVVLGEVTVSAE